MVALGRPGGTPCVRVARLEIAWFDRSRVVSGHWNLPTRGHQQLPGGGQLRH
jgi:hypothetical protein